MTVQELPNIATSQIGAKRVYFIWAHNTGLFKIGESTLPLMRLRYLKKQYKDCELELLTTIQCSRRITEKRIHQTFAHLRQEGEWFWAEDDLLDFVVLIRDIKDPIKKQSAVEQRLIELDKKFDVRGRFLQKKEQFNQKLQKEKGVYRILKPI